MKFTTLTAATALAVFGAGWAQAQQSITVNIGSSHPEANIWVYAMKNAFQPEVDRILAEGGEYKITWNEAYGGTLYKFTDTREAVMDGIVDVGMVGTVWEGANMPLQNVTYFTPFATPDHKMIIEIFDELSETLPELRDSWAENNMVHLSSLITDSYDIYANFPVNSMADLQNRKLNAPGTSANWLQGTGATPVDGALTTYYTNIQTGVTEGALSFASGILPTRVYEVAPELTRVGHRVDVFRRDRGQQGLLRGSSRTRAGGLPRRGQGHIRGAWRLCAATGRPRHDRDAGRRSDRARTARRPEGGMGREPAQYRGTLAGADRRGGQDRPQGLFQRPARARCRTVAGLGRRSLTG